MGILDDVIADDSYFAFHDLDTFAESVTLRPPTGSSRTIKVTINRDVAPNDEEMNQGYREIMLVTVDNHATRGIASTDFVAEKYRIDLAYRHGETARIYTLRMPVSHDSGMLVFRVY